MAIASAAVEIRKESKQHANLVNALRGRVEKSRRAMSQRYEQWRRNEEQFLAYMPARELDIDRRNLKTAGIPQYTTIEIPYSYALLMTAHTYYSTVFLSRDPVFQYMGRHGETQTAEQAVEALMHYQVNSGANLMPLYIWLLDVGKYGLGVVGHYWDEELIVTSQVVESPRTFMGAAIPGTKHKVRKTFEIPGYVGNRVFNTRPQDFLPDPSVPIWRFQEGEFCARYTEIPWGTAYDLFERKIYFNREHARLSRGVEVGRERGSSQLDLPNADNWEWFANENSAVLKGHEIYVRLVPSEWGLGASKRRELWVFTMIGEDLIIGAQPLGLIHNKFPFSVIEYELDGYALFTRSMLETLKPLQDTLTWLINTHFYNVRKTLNGEFTADPSRVVMKDFDDPNAGRIIRIKPAGYGQDIRTMVGQLPVANVTGTHVQDSQIVMEMMQRLPGVTENVMGMVNAGGRKTATEIRSSNTFSVNRLKTNTEVFSAMGFAPLSHMLLANTQQLYELERKYRIVGDMIEGAEKYIDVTPEMIAGAYDFVPVDGTMPVDRLAMAKMWQEMLGSSSKIPQVMQQWDFGRLFGYVGRLMGLRNVNQFKIQMRDDGALQQAAQRGDVVPLPTAAPPRSQMPGMGPTNVNRTQAAA